MSFHPGVLRFMFVSALGYHRAHASHYSSMHGGKTNLQCTKRAHLARSERRLPFRYAVANLSASARATHGGTNCSKSPWRLATSRTTDDERYMYWGGDMMKSVSSAWFNW